MDIAPFLDKPTAIVGTTGAGKTFAAKGAVEHLLELGRRVIIIDPTGAWYGLRAGASGSAEGGFPVLIFGGDHADIPISPDAGEQLAEAIAGRDVQAIIDTSEMTGGEKTRFMTAFLQKLYAMNKAALHLVVDEADEICPQNPMPEERRLSGAFDKIVRRGRIKGFRPLMITQRPAVLHKNVLSQIGTLIALKLTSPQDRKAIEDWVKGNADAGQARKVMSSLPTLQRGEGWVWSPADDVLERVCFPAIRTFDSSRTPGADEAAVEPALSSVDVDALRAAMKIAPATARQTPGASAEIDERDPRIQKMLKEAWADGRKTGAAEEWARGSSAIRAELEALARDADSAASDAAAVARRVRSLGAAIDQISNEAGKPGEARQRVESPSLAGSNPAPASPTVQPATKSRPVNQIPGRPVSGQLPDVSLTPAKRRILSALRDLEAIGQTAPDKQVVAWFADASPKSSTFANNLGAMRTAGLIEYPGQGTIALTPNGAAIEAPRSAPTHDHIMGLVAGKLTPALRRMLEAAVRAYPGALGTADLAEAAGASPTSSTFANNRGRLRSLGLIDYPSSGQVRAADLLFPGGVR